MTTVVADDGAYRADHVDKNVLRIGRQIGLDGAMGRVYEVDGGRHYYKEYLEPERHTIRLNRLIEWRNRLSAQHRALLDRHCAWPQLAVTADGAVVGFLMSPAPDEFWTDMLGEPHTRELQHLIHVNVARQLGITMPTRGQRLHLVADLAILLEFLGRNNIVYGDVNEKNVLWTVEGIPRIYLIDCDNARPADLPDEIAGVAMPRSDDWRDPDLPFGALPNLNSDRYSLAVFYYRVFYGVMVKINKDRNSVLVPDDAPELPSLEDLLRNGLAPPIHRPSPGRWAAAISMIDKASLDQVVPTVADWLQQPPLAIASQPQVATTSSDTSRPVNWNYGTRPRRKYSRAQAAAGAFVILTMLLIALIIAAIV